MYKALALAAATGAAAESYMPRFSSTLDEINPMSHMNGVLLFYVFNFLI